MTINFFNLKSGFWKQNCFYVLIAVLKNVQEFLMRVVFDV